MEPENQQIRMIVKIHTNAGRLIIAICDKDILGKTFSEGDKQLDLSSNFYKGEEVGEEKLKEMIKKASVINAVGKKSIDFLEKEGLINEDNIFIVENIPHAQYVLISNF